MAEDIDQFTLLCKSCGYALTGLPAEGKCPECGRTIVESLPERRVGSAWQRHPGVRGWLTTTASTILRPSALFDQLAIEVRRSRSLTAVNLSLAVALVCTALAPSASPVELLIGAGGGLLFLVVLTAIEFLGVQFFGRRRRWRVTPAVALAVCAHASIGWVAAALLGILGALVTGWASAGDRTTTLWVVSQSLPVFGFLAGMMVFETLVYIGIRRCRFANRVPPDAAA